MNTKFFTNEDQNTLLNKIEGIFKYKNIHFFDALVGYFRASGYFKIRDFIEKAEEIRILVGINIDALVYEADQQGVLFDGSREKAQEDFYKEIKKNIQEAEYDKAVEEGMIQLISDIITEKVKIRIHPKQNIHAKLYIFREKEKHDHGYGSVITGSSNLTDAGLYRNFEFNVELRENADIDFATVTFDKLWKESVPVDLKSIEKITSETYLNDTYTPYEVYLKFLIEYFGKSIEFDPNSVTDLPKGYKRLSYQIDAVNDGYAKMIKHNGFFLADVVGLGKTMVATLIAKKYFYTNGFPEHRSHTLIVVPPALKEIWHDTVEQFRLDNVEIITNGSLHKIKNAAKYDLVIVDEAHKFRSDSSEMYNALQKICKTPTRRRISENNYVPKRVILVSATPLNNAPQDIANQIFLFQDSKNSTLEIGNLQHFFRKQIDAYNKLKKNKNIKEVQEKVKLIYENIRIKVIEPLIVRRTRTDLLAHEQYSADLEKAGITFPRVGQPKKILYVLKPYLEKLYDKTIYILSNSSKGLTYNRYRAISFLKPHKKIKYQQADMVSTQLAKIMKTLLVKRVDSSFYAFKQSLYRFMKGTEAMVTMFRNGKIYIAPNLPVSEMINDNKEEELFNLILEKSIEDPTIDICEPDDFEDGFLLGLEHDLNLLKELNNEWSDVDEDPKLDVFVDYLNNTLFNTKINKQSKLVVFSESKETTDYLNNELSKQIKRKVLTIDSKSRREKMQHVRENFDANIPIHEQRNDFSILVTTEVLAEGINLHRSNVIVNYDTPWNSTRLMQRIGRVNRIGSTADEIHVYNFYPTAQVDTDIELKKKAIMKLQAFHAALGEDSQIYSPDEETESFGLFDKELEEEKDEKLSYLMLIRSIKEKTPGLYKQIKNMPLRSRVGRINQALNSTSICYIKDMKRDAFIQVTPEGITDELTFLETAKIFEANVSEKAIMLHDKHHEQVQVALSRFSDMLQKERARDKRIDITQGPNEKRAQEYLSAIRNMPLTNEEERQLIDKAKEAIGHGRFQNLQRDINKFKRNTQKSHLKPAIILEKIIEILKKYPFLIEDDLNIVNDHKQIMNQTNIPKIIITESFNET
jgi:superfamily II DNA/RNA helicase/HKD family nuclease